MTSSRAGGGVAVSLDSSIPELFAAVVGSTPDAIAAVDGTMSLSYAELDRRSNQLAAALRARGIGSGASVGVAFERSIELPVTLLGILKIGANYVPLDRTYPAERFAFIIADAALTAVVTREPICDPALYAGLEVLDVIDDAAEIAASDAAASDRNVDFASTAYVAYTSGSTGRPKGVAISHRNVARLVRDVDYCEMSPGRTFLHFAPLAFDASTFEIWAPLLNGATLAIARPGLHSVEDLGDVIARFGVTTMFLTTALFQRIVDRHVPEFSGLRHVLTGGEVASPRHMRDFLVRYPATRLSAVYGPTENTTFSTWCDLTTPKEIGEDVPIGRPIAHSSAYVLDDRMEMVEPGEIGELCVGGAGVGLGYVGLSALTAERFVGDPYAREPGARMYRTGDRARIRPDGLISFLGRVDDQVKVRGYRIELGEIEAALLAGNDVVDAAVVAVLRDGGEKVLVAFAVPSDGAVLEAASLRTRLAEKLPSFMIPHRIEIIAGLPEHASGKLDRVALGTVASDLLVRSKAVAAAAVPKPRGRTELERAIAAAWSEALGDVAERDVNFFDAGGDSLRLLTLQAALQEHLGVALAVTDLFEHSTIAQQVAFFGSRR